MHKTLHYKFMGQTQADALTHVGAHPHVLDVLMPLSSSLRLKYALTN